MKFKNIYFWNFLYFEPLANFTSKFPKIKSKTPKNIFKFLKRVFNQSKRKKMPKFEKSSNILFGVFLSLFNSAGNLALKKLISNFVLKFWRLLFEIF